MSLAEINLFGVHVVPLSVMLLLAWAVTIALRRIADHLGLMHHVWHPPLFMGAIYVIVLSSIVLIGAR